MADLPTKTAAPLKTWPPKAAAMPPDDLAPPSDHIAEMFAPRIELEPVRGAPIGSRHPLYRLDLLLAVALFAAALLARAPFIARGETLLHSDEAIVGIMAQDIAEGRRWPIYFYGQRYMGALEAYVIAALLPVFDDPITALRLGPTLFFATLAAVQFLMLTRWFGRAGGLAGAAALIAAAPMFVQWSVSARGGYIEILLWGTLLLWAYSEWFTDTGRMAAQGRGHATRRFFFGALIGSGVWINPTIVVFLAPIVAHALLAGTWRERLGVERWLAPLGRAALPVVALLGLLVMNVVYAVWVEQGQVRRLILLGLLPDWLEGVLIVSGLIALVIIIHRRTSAFDVVRNALNRNAWMLFGALLGATPAILYIAIGLLGHHAIDPALPLGLRPLWKAGDTLLYLLTGMPLLLGADPRLFLQLVSVGRDSALMPLDPTIANGVAAASWLTAGAMLTLAGVLLVRWRDEIDRLLRLEPRSGSPFVLLLLGFAGMLGFYVMGGCALDFTTIRYFVPMWAFLPGLLAAAVARDGEDMAAQSRGHATRPAARAAPHLRRIGGTALIALLAAWSAGQMAMVRQLGRPHPLRGVADELVAQGVTTAIAEPLDAHLLSYLTRGRCRVAEFESFWPRLWHYRASDRAEDSPARIHYIVDTTRVDWSDDWIAGGWPGEPPPETHRFLWPRLRRHLHLHPWSLLDARRLGPRYSLITLDQPLRERPPVG
jgi:hypothetical protein